MADEKRYYINDILLTCPHCAGEYFERDSAQLNTAGFTFLGIDWANQSALTFICTTCGSIQWFLNPDLKTDL